MANVGPYLQTGMMRKVSRFADQFPLTATQYFRNDGGRFVTLQTGTGYYSLSTSSSTQADGWVDLCYAESFTTNPTASTPFTASSTAGASVVPGTKDIYGTDCIFGPIPVATGSTVTALYLDKLCDLAVEGSTTTTKQVVAIDVTTNKVVKIVAVDIVNNAVYVTAVQKSA